MKPLQLLALGALCTASGQVRPAPRAGRIAFASKQDGTWDIHVTDGAGGREARLTAGPADDRFPVWSPDGRMYTIRPDGSGLTRRTNDPADDRSPAWSLDGRMIAFASSRTGQRQPM